MTKKNIILGVALVVVIILIGAWALNQQTSLQNKTTAYNPKTQGKVVFGITDATADITGVSSVFVTINNIQIHSAVNGWKDISSETKQYDLLALKNSGTVSLLANANVDVGTYDQVKLAVSKVVVVRNGVSTEAKLPSGELKIIGNIVVSADKTSSIVFDVLADKSLHLTGSGKFIFAPVLTIKKQTDADIEVTSNNQVNIKNGQQEDDEHVGMDEKGEVKDNFELKGNLNIDDKDEINFEGNHEESSGKDSKTVVLNFSAQSNSGLSGTATLMEQDGKVKVSLKLMGGVLGLPNPSEPAHVHYGSCANIGGVKYPLNSVVNGKSETTLNTSLSQLKAQLPLAINVHKSDTEIGVYIACTDISL